MILTDENQSLPTVVKFSYAANDVYDCTSQKLIENWKNRGRDLKDLISLCPHHLHSGRINIDDFNEDPLTGQFYAGTHLSPESVSTYVKRSSIGKIFDVIETKASFQKFYDSLGYNDNAESEIDSFRNAIVLKGASFAHLPDLPPSGKGGVGLSGDSGGPILIQENGVYKIAGVFSGGDTLSTQNKYSTQDTKIAYYAPVAIHMERVQSFIKKEKVQK